MRVLDGWKPVPKSNPAPSGLPIGGGRNSANGLFLRLGAAPEADTICPDSGKAYYPTS